ncbi:MULTISPECIES: AarF/ABC1/UbiB kinase family protein [unclassified Limnobacter]|uniref:ABC1 kinase family protein n=1 Tax=unclassified Limnobacter TaxID=2630203 RepID=UPI000C3A050C|nr:MULTISPECIES: AarF/ABC1/UbiB kinase family protein [unclassified Limnobacter]MAZ09589.1 ABC transporter [Sutterellaceae bacterium]MAZ10567.1 ABC transporter [Sutterellaceae bacterium]|tara:strand:- start:37881 stop:39308 length:1428 start_codon:yes stop_codon:yes gene_type:complete
MAEQDKSDNVEANAKADADGSTMDRIKTGAFERNVALTRMGVGAGAKIASHTVRNFFRRGDSKDEANRNFYRAQAKELADELGRLKGSVMKAGQMLSLYGQYFLPEEAVEVLATLQDNTPAVSWSFVEPQLIDALGEKTIAKLDIQRKPIAAASLGQAHLATIKATGEQVVVKIQYPGVANAIDTDIRTLSRLISATRLAPKALDLTDVFNELRDMLVRECDYLQEREFTETFHDRLANNSRFIVPKVYPEFCAQRVLTTRYEPGYSVSSKEVQALSQSRRNALAKSFAELFVTEFFDWNLVQTDPHFGNYRVRIDSQGENDQIVTLDFGATRPFDKSFVESYGRIVRGSLQADRREVAQGVLEIGLMDASTPQSFLEGFGDLTELIVEPFRKPFDPMVPDRLYTPGGAYRFGDTDLPARVGQTAALKMMSKHFKIPPQEIIFLHRRIGGVLVTLKTLRAELRLHELLKPYLGLS